MALVFLALLVPGCSPLTPIYGDASRPRSAQASFRFSEPETRLEQIVYRELSLRFAQSTAPGTPELTVSTTRRARDLGKTSREPFDQTEVTVIATATVMLDGAVVYSATRQAAAIYADSDQILANVSARDDAEERAARAAAESLRLALLASFARGPLQQPSSPDPVALAL
jgi:hypothetical protein